MSGSSNAHGFGQPYPISVDGYVATQDNNASTHNPHSYFEQHLTEVIPPQHDSYAFNAATSPRSAARREQEFRTRAAEARYNAIRDSQAFSAYTHGGDFNISNGSDTSPVTTSHSPISMPPEVNSNYQPRRNAAVRPQLRMHTNSRNGLAQLRPVPAATESSTANLSNHGSNVWSSTQYSPHTVRPATDPKPTMGYDISGNQYYASPQDLTSMHGPADMSQAGPPIPVGGAPRLTSYYWQGQSTFDASHPSNFVHQPYANPNRKRSRSDDQTVADPSGHFAGFGSIEDVYHPIANMPSVYAPTNRVTEGELRRRKSSKVGAGGVADPSTPVTNTLNQPVFGGLPNLPAPSVSGVAAMIPAVSAYPTVAPPANSTDPTDPSFTLAFGSAALAEAYAHRIRPLDVKNDDVEEVRNDQQSWVRRVMKAILQPTNLSHTDEQRGSEKKVRDLTNDEAAEFTRWQIVNAQPVLEVPNLEGVDDIVTIVEAIAWQFVKKVLQIHTEGVRLSPFATDDTSKCSVRLTKAIALIDQYALVRYDIFNNPTCDAFARAPEKFKDRKTNNLWVNLGKKGGRQSQTAGKRKTPYSLLTNYYPRKEINQIKKQNEAEEEYEQEEQDENEGEQEEEDDSPAPAKSGKAKGAKQQGKGRKSKKSASGATTNDASAPSSIEDDEGDENAVDSTSADAENVNDSELSFLSDFANDDPTESAMMAPPLATPARFTTSNDGGRPSKRARFSL